MPSLKRSLRAARPVRRAATVVARSVCPVACTLDLVGDKWTLLVVRDLMFGKTHFKDFLASPEGVATNILTQRLARLMASGLIERYPSEVYAGRDAYRLTAKGLSLRPLLEQMAAWGLMHIEGTSPRITYHSARSS